MHAPQENADAKVNSIKEEAKNAAILTNYKRQEGLQADILLENSKSAVSIAKDLNNLSNQEVLDKEYINNLQTIINKEDALNAVKNQGKLTDLQTLELEALGRSKQTLNLEKAKNDILEARAALQRKFGIDQESTQQKIDAGLRNNTSTVQLEVDLIQQKITETKRLNDIDGKDGKDLERNLALHKEILASLERQHEAKKRNFMKEDNTPQIIYDEAAKRANDFAANMKDTVTGVFDAVYSGMDAAIDDITTKMMNGTKIKLKEVLDLFRNTVAEGFREMAAEQMKSSARNLIKDVMGAVMPGLNLDTPQEKANILLTQIALNTGIMATAASGIGIGIGIGTDSSMSPSLDNATTSAAYFNDRVDETGNKLDEFGNTVSKGFVARIGDSVTGLLGPEGLMMTLFSGMGIGLKSIAMNIIKSLSSNSGGGGGFLKTLFSIGSSIIGGMASGGMSGTDMSAGFAASGQGMDIGNYMAGASNYTPSYQDIGKGLGGMKFANGGIMSEYGALKLNKYSSGGIANSPQMAMYGDIMSEYGALKLNKYASGGIANSPQMAIYGEGRMNEAYVPLPDGRTIPVTMQGNSNSGSGPINVVVNVDASGNSNTQTTGANNADDAKRLGMIISGKVREEIVNQQRSGGLLNKR